MVFQIRGWLFLCSFDSQSASYLPPRIKRISPSHVPANDCKNILHRYILLIAAFKQLLTDHWLVIMRFQNWDVLLFPEESKAPLQEFRTGCFVISDPGRSYLLPAFCPFPQQRSRVANPESWSFSLRYHNLALRKPPSLPSPLQIRRN